MKTALLALLALASVGCDRSPTATAGKPLAEISVRASAARVVDSTFDDIKFEIAEDEAFERSMLTPKASRLLDRKIRIRGYMFPTLKNRGLKQFVLVRDNLECCFGPGAALFDCIVVHMNEGKTAEFSIRPIAVEGTFRFEEVLGPDGKPMAIYRLDGDSAE